MSNQQNNDNDILWQQLKTIPAFRAVLRSVEARFYHHIHLPGPTLDVGCGDGHFSQMTFAEPLAVGTDPWWGPLQKAQASGMYQTVLQGMGDYQPFPDYTFGSAFSNSVLEHIPQVQAVLNETSRVLKPGAPFVITMPSHYFTEYLGGAAFLERLGLRGLANKYREFFNFISRHAHTDSPEVWAQRLAEAGFAVERWQYYFSKEALRALEWGHVQGLPSAVLHFLTGHWIIAPWRDNLQRTERWVRPFFEEEFGEEGAYILIIARKVADGPIRATLPAAYPFTVAELAEEGEARGEGRGESVADSEWQGAGGKWQVVAADEVVAAATAVVDEVEVVAERPSMALPSLDQIAPRRWLFVAGLVLAFVAQSLGAAAQGGLAIVAWLAATAVTFYAFTDEKSPISNLPISQSPNLKNLLIPTLLFIAALLVRTIKLTELPFILNGTEASLGLDMQRVLDGSLTNPFAAGWLTNPTLPYTLLAIPIKLLGPSTLAIRLLSPWVGAATVLLVYLLGKRLWGQAVGLTAAVLLLGSHFHVHFSRMGVTNVWDPFMVLLALGLLALAWEQPQTSEVLKTSEVSSPNQRRLWLLAGLAIGLNAYFFTSSHLLPIMLIGLLGLTAVLHPRQLLANWPHILATIGLALVVALPLVLYYNSNPGIYFERANTLGILDSQSGWLSREVGFTGQSRSQLWWQQIRRGLLAFNSGVDNSPSYRPDAPLLGLGPSLLFLLGLGLAIWRIHRLQDSMLVVWVAVTLIFGAILLENPPNSHRLIVAAPALSLLAGLALVWIGRLVVGEERLVKSEGRGAMGEGHEEEPPHAPRPTLLVFILVVIAVALAGMDVFFYYGRYQTQHTFGDRNTEIADNMSHYLNALGGDEWVAYFYGPPSMYVGFPTIPFLAQDFYQGLNLFDVPPEGGPLPDSPAPNQVFIFLPERSGELQGVQNQFPGGEVKTFAGFHSDPLFYAYELPAATEN